MSNQDCNAASLQTSLLISNLIITTLVAVITAVKIRARCGHNICTCKPKDAPDSPASADNSPHKNAVAIVIDSPSNHS